MYDFYKFLEKNCKKVNCKYSELKDNTMYLDISCLEDLCFWLPKSELMQEYNAKESDIFVGFELVNKKAYRIDYNNELWYFDTLEELNIFEEEHCKHLQDSIEYCKEWGNIQGFNYKENCGFYCENTEEHYQI